MEFALFLFLSICVILSAIYLYFHKKEVTTPKKKNFKLTPCFKLNCDNGIITVRLFLGGECIAQKNINSQISNVENEIIKVKDELVDKLYKMYEDHKLINHLIEKHSTIIETSFTIER